MLPAVAKRAGLARLCGISLVACLSLAVSLCQPGPVFAHVLGACADCHTMHNSQEGEAVWSGTPRKGDGGQYLVKQKCIGCHSSTDSSPTKQLGPNTVPIVYNTVEPSAMTAGGNFFYVQDRGDGYGHNVITPDAHLAQAPKADMSVGTCGFGGCHASLARIRLGAGGYWVFNPLEGNGCIGCHVARHHAPDPAPGQPTTEENGYYRFLGKPSWVWDIPHHSSRPGVQGIEDPDWELTVSATDHNEYRDANKPGAPFAPGYTNPRGISDFCNGCHQGYHSYVCYNTNHSSSGWLRHPAGDSNIPASGEFLDYTLYDPLVPVSRQTLSGVSGAVTPGSDRVMCLSCHRAHGSPYPDMLRWDYSNLAEGTGCLKCHTSKN